MAHKGRVGGLYSGENKKVCQEEIRRAYGSKTPAKEFLYFVQFL